MTKELGKREIRHAKLCRKLEVLLMANAKLLNDPMALGIHEAQWREREKRELSGSDKFVSLLEAQQREVKEFYEEVVG